MAFQALECPIFKTFVGGCDTQYFHLRRAFWASWHQVNVRKVWDSAFEFWHTRSLSQAEHYRTLSHRRLTKGSLWSVSKMPAWVSAIVTASNRICAARSRHCCGSSELRGGIGTVLHDSLWNPMEPLQEHRRGLHLQNPLYTMFTVRSCS